MKWSMIICAFLAYCSLQAQEFVSGNSFRNIPPGSYIPSNSVTYITTDPYVSPVLTEYNHAVELRWRTNNTAIDHFEIERSQDGTVYEFIGNLSANRNANDSPYYFPDVRPYNGLNYYRVKFVDASGLTAYSANNIILYGKEKMDVIIYDNPVTMGRLNLQLVNLPAARCLFTLYTETGTPVLSKEMDYDGGSSTELINLQSTLAKGIYFLTVANRYFTIKKKILLRS
ncbi:MAG: type sorting protein [Chitinophagaceae bacterium]|nr:type sorting protein [Chitinophagaceae bacterium]